MPPADPTEENPGTVSFTEEALRGWLEMIVGERHLKTSRQHHEATRELIRQTFVSAGLDVSEQPVRGPFGTGHNIIGRLEGRRAPRREWILGAHYDTVTGTPGADDNGIAVAGLLELACALDGFRSSDTVELVAWDLEEPQTMATGIARGSRAMARSCRAARREICGVIVLEMIGCCLTGPGTQRSPPGTRLVFPAIRRWLEAREDRGDFLAVVADRRSLQLSDALARAGAEHGLPLVQVPVRGPARLIPDFYRSDHAPFWARSYPAVMLTDTADFRNGHYHRPSDTIDTVDLGFACRVMRTAAAALLELAGG